MPPSDYVQTIRSRIGHDLLILTGAGAIIRNQDGAILLQRRSDSGLWGIPGGMIEPGEEPAAAVIREVHEETGLDVVPERITGVYGGASHITTYPNGDNVAITSITFECRVVGGRLEALDGESLELVWFAPDALPESLLPRHRERIMHALTRREPFFRLPDGVGSAPTEQ